MYFQNHTESIILYSKKDNTEGEPEGKPKLGNNDKLKNEKKENSIDTDESPVVIIQNSFQSNMFTYCDK